MNQTYDESTVIVCGRVSRFAVAMIFGAMIFSVPESIATAQSTSQSTTQSDASDQPSQALIDEINSIRKQLGGGIAEKLKGLELGQPAEAQLNKDFENELKRLATQQPPSIADVPTSPAMVRGTESDKNGFSILNRPYANPGPAAFDRNFKSATKPSRMSGDANGRIPFFHRMAQDPRGATGIVSSDQGFSNQESDARIKQLRVSARQLDEVAAGLEEVGLYSQADSIREQARIFWHQARPTGERH